MLLGFKGISVFPQFQLLQYFQIKLELQRSGRVRQIPNIIFKEFCPMISRATPLPSSMPLFPCFPLFHIISPHPWKVGDTRQYQHIFSTIFDQPKYGKYSCGTRVRMRQTKKINVRNCEAVSFLHLNHLFVPISSSLFCDFTSRRKAARFMRKWSLGIFNLSF